MTRYKVMLANYEENNSTMRGKKKKKRDKKKRKRVQRVDQTEAETARMIMLSR